MKILMISDFYPPFIGGMYRHTQTLSRAFVKRGHEVIVCTIGNKYLNSYDDDLGVRVIRFEGFFQRMRFLFKDANVRYPPPVQDFLLSRKLGRIIKREKPDIIHCHGWILYSVLPLKKYIEIPLVVTLHDCGYICPKIILLKNDEICDRSSVVDCVGCAGNTYGWVKSLFTCYGVKSNEGSLRFVDQFIAVSSFVKEFYSKHLTLSKKVVVIPNLYETQKEDFRSNGSETFPEDFILFVGDLSPHKGVDVLIDAYGKLETQTKLLLIGKRYPNHSYKDNENVMIIENAPHKIVMEACSKCKFLVIAPICPDACPTVALEAMSCRKPIVASNTGGLKDIVLDRETGILVPPNDSKKLANAINFLLQNPTARDQMGKKGFERLLAEFDSSIVVSKIERIYNDLLSHRICDLSS